MKQRQCYLCKSQDFIEIAGRVRDRDDLEVLKCNSCGLVSLSSFNHIEKDFYENSKMHDESLLNLSEWIEKTETDDERRYQMLKTILEGKTLLDFGTGNCNFLSKVSYISKQVIGIEPEKRMRKQISDIRLYGSISDIKPPMKFDIITMFHVIEHLPNPRTILSKLCNILTDKGRIFIETPNTDDALLTLYKNKAFMDFTYWSCHLFLYNFRTLNELANQSGLKLNYIRQIQRYSLANHLYWLVKGKPNGHEHWNFFTSDKLNNEYEKQLSSLGKCDTFIGNFSRKEL